MPNVVKLTTKEMRMISLALKLRGQGIRQAGGTVGGDYMALADKFKPAPGAGKAKSP